MELTYSSNTIEGNTLSLREKQPVVEEKLAPGQGKTLREIYEARNHYAAVKEVERYVAKSRDINTRAIHDLHQMVMRDIDATWGGRLRNGPVFIKGTRHTPPNAARVGEDLIRSFPGRGKARCIPCSLPPRRIFDLNRCTRFFDGNGRTGRLLRNWQLLRAGLPLTVIQVQERVRYLDALD